jgi:hypothetical protein
MNTLQHRLAEALRDAQKCINSMRIEFRLHGQITDASAHWAIVTEPKVMQALREHDSSAQGWQPIETAPKDGTRILVFDEYDAQDVAWWAPEEGGEWSDSLQEKINGGEWIDGTVADWGCQEYRHLRPTHWMHLPAAPSAPNADEVKP